MNILILAAVCWSAVAYPVRAIDGDTIVVAVLPWFNIQVEETVRILGVDTPERREPKWDEAKRFTQSWIGWTEPLTITACKRDKYGRALGSVSRGQEDLGRAIINGGYSE